MLPLKIIDLGTAPYAETCALQKALLLKRKLGDIGDHLILVEHPNVLTIGRRGLADNILIDSGSLKKEDLSVIRADRGGDITFHGPGQIVAYPIFDLRDHDKDIRIFLSQLESVMALTLKMYSIKDDKDNGCTGIWVNSEKIGFIGIGVSGWVTYHGISLNVNTDLRYFSMIIPCGIKDAKITSMKKILAGHVDIGPLKRALIDNFCEVFNFERSYSQEDAAMAFAEAAGSGHQ